MIKCTVPLALAAMLSVAAPVLAAASEAAPTPQSVIPLNFASRDAFELVPHVPGTHIIQRREFRAVSASGRHYVPITEFVSPKDARPRSGGGSSVINERGCAFALYRVVLLRFIPADRLLQPDPIQVKVRMNDGVEGHSLLRRHAVKFPEANWPFPPDVSDELKEVEGTTYVFKFDESDTTPLTFHLP